MSTIKNQSMLKFGQPYGSIIQQAYIVPDIHQAILDFSNTYNIGPFYLVEHFPLINAVYRGQPCEADVTIAIAYSGSMSIELIQQNNNAPSPWLETRDKRGWGYHHCAIACRDFQEDVNYYNSRGFETVLYTEVSMGTAAAYVETTAANYGMIELIEMKEPVEDFFNTIKEGCLSWNGKNPIRTFGEEV